MLDDAEAAGWNLQCKLWKRREEFDNLKSPKDCSGSP